VLGLMTTAHDSERLASDDAAIAKWAADLPAIHPMEVRLALQRLFASAAELANGLAQLLATSRSQRPPVA